MTKTEEARLLVGVAKHVLDTLTEDETRSIIDAIENATTPITVDPFDFEGNAFRDLLGGEIVELAPAGCEEAITITVYAPDEKTLAVIYGWADLYVANVEATRFDITRINIFEHGRLSPAGFDALGDALLAIIRNRANAELNNRRKRRQEAGDNAV